MNDTQRVSVAAGFIYALSHSKDVREVWKVIAASRDWRDLRDLIQQTLGLAHEPTEHDLKWMRDFADKNLMPELDELHKLDNEVDAQYVFNGR